MTSTFKISKLNLIYLLVIVLTTCSIAYTVNVQFNGIAIVSGLLLILILVPSLVSFVFWRLSKKKESTRNVAFTVTLTLLIFISSKTINEQINHEIKVVQQFSEMKAQKNQFKKDIATQESPQEFDAAYDQYANSVVDGFANLSEKSKGQEKLFYKILQDLAEEGKSEATTWNDSLNDILNPRILDYSLLTSDKEFKFQKKVISNYIEQTKLYRTFMVNLSASVEKHLSVLGPNSKLASDTLKGLNKKFKQQMEVYRPLLKAHVEYGNTMLDILSLLEDNPNQWSYENSELVFSNGQLEISYMAKQDILINTEATIIALSEQAIEGL